MDRLFIDSRRLGRSYAAEPDVVIEQLRKDQAITEAAPHPCCS